VANATNGADSRHAGPCIDVLVVGAGFAGLYMLARLRRLGFSARGVEAGTEIGGTWFWNRYPGLRCDIPTTDYTYTWDPDLESEWQWSEKFATQPEILRYLQHVADKHDLRRDIQLSARVEAATWETEQRRWRVETDCGETILTRHVVMATGSLSVPKPVDIPGLADFPGDVYSSAGWPEDGVDFTGRRVAVVGTGSSGIQVIPIVAEQASELVVFQRTPAFTLPARNGAAPEYRRKMLADDRQAYRTAAKWSSGGVPIDVPLVKAVDLTTDERRLRCEWAWQMGELASVNSVFADHITDRYANDVWVDFLRNKIRETVHDPATADTLTPKDFPFMAKRPCFDTGYYETFNKPHVRLVDIRKQPITRITAAGIETADGTIELDAIVLATGYDAITGALASMDITGAGGRKLDEKWKHGPVTYLGLMTSGFPNLYMITGPGSPSVLSNMIVSIEQHVDWISRCLHDLRDSGFDTIEPTPAAEEGWVRHVNDCADITLFPAANSWYLGSNVPGKPRVFMPYVGGVGVYRASCDDVVAKGYLGFTRTGPAGILCNDGVVNALQPDVAELLRRTPSHEFASPDGHSTSHTVWQALTSATSLPVGAQQVVVSDGTLLGAATELPYRLYRPGSPAPAPAPLTVYFHGGGWVFGDHTTDDALCRSLCAESGTAIISVGYRRAPYARFPAATDDAAAALTWIADHAAELGTDPAALAVAGWCAGANLAAVTAQWARDYGGPRLAGQVLITPVTDAALEGGSRLTHAEAPGLSGRLLRWFLDQYVDQIDCRDPRVSPLRAADLSGLAPALVVVAEFDPLADDGMAYADALQKAGTPAQVITARGHLHTSLLNTDLLSGARYRRQIAAALGSFFAEKTCAPASSVATSAMSRATH